MLIGDRGLGVGSSIRGHRRYGGIWKQVKHAENTYVCITNEQYTSQTCVYCFNFLQHPTFERKVKGRIIRKQVKGCFLCVNPSCSLVKQGKAVLPRDRLSALAIGIVGLSQVTMGETFPPFASLRHSKATFLDKSSQLLKKYDQ